MSFRFLHHQGAADGPRLGTLVTPHGEVSTPTFMPVATRGMLRGPWPDRLRPMGVEMMLANSFHLYSRPGVESVQKLGGLHKMMAWDGPVLTDSGGFQAFSLSAISKVSDDGVRIAHPVHGGMIDWTPKLAFEVQAALAPDVAMLLDECPADPRDRKLVKSAVGRTLRWARLQRDMHDARGGADSGQAQFGIVQGGVFEELRGECATGLIEMDFDGYAIGGVSVGEGHDAMMDGVRHSTSVLPVDKARYLMGVGTPLDLVESVARGIDMFDCVYPTRSGRFGSVLTDDGILHMHNAKFKDDPRPLLPGCDCDACATGVPRGALRAGLKAKELLPPSLLAHHNLHYLVKLMERIRTSIADGTFEALREKINLGHRREEQAKQ
ncbi:MAG: tRNA guanosine(34) transglycosylase Tgt [Planctomycetes bacterium]|nr:tRNA guanosine(34) transglycosylase Tgt [Planctomycetota bacterium]MCP4772185.1 tRNA guanosine(34) transglycosylase Tgt [Planctomycetota bacterium]MCP4861241.1 tRNA guanosine(34) transglycosylase Tgt [Planctomycetota bacterium]